MKRALTLLGAILLGTSMLSSCGGGMTICDCLKDKGTNMKECEEMAKGMTEAELVEEISNCQ
jgi:hypothetical protein